MDMLGLHGYGGGKYDIGNELELQSVGFRKPLLFGNCNLDTMPFDNCSFNDDYLFGSYNSYRKIYLYDRYFNLILAKKASDNNFVKIYNNRFFVIMNDGYFYELDKNLEILWSVKDSYSFAEGDFILENNFAYVIKYIDNNNRWLTKINLSTHAIDWEGYNTSTKVGVKFDYYINSFCKINDIVFLSDNEKNIYKYDILNNTQIWKKRNTNTCNIIGVYGDYLYLYNSTGILKCDLDGKLITQYNITSIKNAYLTKHGIIVAYNNGCLKTNWDLTQKWNIDRINDLHMDNIRYSNANDNGDFVILGRIPIYKSSSYYSTAFLQKYKQNIKIIN